MTKSTLKQSTAGDNLVHTFSQDILCQALFSAPSVLWIYSTQSHEYLLTSYRGALHTREVSAVIKQPLWHGVLCTQTKFIGSD